MHKLVFYYPQGHQEHYEYGHPERPERIETARKALREAGWWDKYPKLEPLAPDVDLLESIHSPEYIERLRKTSERGDRLDMDTYTTKASWKLANNAVGGALAVSRAVWLGEAQRGLALTRPPGHHATIDRGMGFCLLNNIALAAQDLLTGDLDNGANAEKLAIVDLDLHHGNGTQDIFWRRDDVFYISTHQSPHYPGTGNVVETGAGPGDGYTANFPLPPLSGDRAFITIMDELIIPLLDRYSPDMILVSFGFDTHWLDPLGHLLLSAGGYGKLIARLTDWADQNCAGRIALFLEGGYDLDADAACIQAVTSALIDDEWNDTLGHAERSETDGWMVTSRRAKEIWKL